MPTGTPYEIDVWEQPPISNVSDLSASLGNDWVHADADDPQVQAEPGVSMSEAVPLPDGETAAVDLPLGKISWFYVPVELGERLQVLVETADGGSIAGAGLEARILSPLGGLIDEADPTTIMPATRSTNLAAGPGMVSTVTYEVDPHHRFYDDAEHSRYAHNIALAGSAGNYLVAVYAQKLSGSSVSSLPVTIKAQTNPHETYDRRRLHAARVRWRLPVVPGAVGSAAGALRSRCGGGEVRAVVGGTQCRGVGPDRRPERCGAAVRAAGPGPGPPSQLTCGRSPAAAHWKIRNSAAALSPIAARKQMIVRMIVA